MKDMNLFPAGYSVDFILRPWDNKKLLATVNAAWKLRVSRLEASILKKDNLLLKRRLTKEEKRLSWELPLL